MLSKTAQYAIRALVYIQMQNKKGNRPGFKEIAKETESPEHFIAKILQTLTRYNMLKSAKGRGGGFFFAPGKAELSVYDVIQVTEGEKYFNQCLFGFNSCDDESPCPLHEDFMKIWNDFTNLAKSQTIDSLAQKIEKKESVLTRSK